MKRIATFVLCLAFCAGIPAQPEEPIVFEDPAGEARFQELTEEFRCLVCQNQSLADSDATLAQDLRKEIHDMIVAGRSDAEIKEFMVARYGDFVLYRPPVQANTLLLWAAPIILLLIGGVVIARSVRKRAALLDSEYVEPPGDHDPDAEQR